MRRLLALLCAAVLLGAGAAGPAHALGQKSFVATERAAAAPGAVVLVEAGRAATLYVDAGDHAGVLRAANHRPHRLA